MMNPISIVIMLISCRVPLKQPPLKEFSIESKLQQDAGIPKNRNLCTVLVRWNNGDNICLRSGNQIHDWTTKNL
jgi:low affinity Fe/Cu permease